MEEIELSIISNEEKEDTINYKYKGIKNDNDNERGINKIKKKYKEWIKDLIIFMNTCNYRKVLKEIEKRKEIFKALNVFDLRKMKIIKLKAIFKIIRIKLKKYKLEIKKENHSQISSIEFWFNQIFFILEELINDFTPNKFDNEIDLDSIKLLKPIQSILDIYLELIFLLIKYHYLRIGYDFQICAYLSIFNSFIPYISFISENKSIFFIQNLLLLKTKIFLQNRNYLQSIQQQKLVFKLCSKSFILLNNFDNKLISDLSFNNDKLSKEIYSTFVIYVIAFYLRGVTFEHLGYAQNACQAYEQSNIIYMKYLIKNHAKFGMFLNRIDSQTKCRVLINNDIINNIKKRKENEIKKKAMKIIQRSSIRLRRSCEYINMTEKNNMSYKKIIKLRNIKRGIKDKRKKQKLEKYLNNMGKNLYLEEENINNNLLEKYTKTKYILSTITMINNLLSEDFQNVLKKMNPIEITKPKEEIKYMIDSIILKKRAKLFNSRFINLRKQNSALNLKRRYKISIINNSIDYPKNKTLMEKNFNNNNIKKMFHLKRNNSSNNYSDKYSSLLIKQIIKQKNELITSQKMSNSNYNKNKKNKEIRIKKNISIDNLDNKIKSDIKRKKGKKKYFHNFNQTQIYPVNNSNFSKIQIRKKNYLDKYLKKEYSFQKKLLNSKRNEVKDLSEIEYYDKTNACDSAKKSFDMILNVKNSNYNSKLISNFLETKQIKINNENKQKKEEKYISTDSFLLKIKNNIINSRYNKNKKRKGFTGISLRKFADKINKDDIKKLDIECIDLSFKMKNLENKRKSLILNVPKYIKSI